MANISHTHHPRDKGWAWMIVIGSFVVDAVNIGYVRSFGLLFVAIQKQYDYSSGLISAVLGAKNVAFCILTVVVMNVLIKKYSVRFLCIIGILFQTMAVSLCTVVQNPVFLILCLGLLDGIGQGFLMLPSRYIVSVYFEKRRSIAVVIASCGASLGGITFPIVTRAVLDFYGLQGALLMIGGIILNQLVFVILYTPPSDYGFSQRAELPNDNENQVAQQRTLLNSDTVSSSAGHCVDSQPDVRSRNCPEQEFPNNERFSSQDSDPQTLEGVANWDTKTEGHGGGFHEDCLLLKSSADTENCESAAREGSGDCIQNRSPTSMDSSPKDSKRRLSLPDVLYSKLFWALFPCFIGCPVGTVCAYVFIPPLAVERGLDGDAGAYFLTITSVMDIAGKLLTGVVLQMGLVTTSLWAIIVQVVGCVLYSFTFLIHDYSGMLILAIVYGPIGGFFYAIQALLIIEVLGMPMLASAIGFYGAVSALTLAASYPIAGSLHDLAGTYSVTFVFLAAMLLLGIVSLTAVKGLKPKKVEVEARGDSDDTNRKTT